MVRSNFDIFVGGPMGKSQDDGAGVPLDRHIGNIALAIGRLKDDLEAKFENVRIEVLNPEVPAFGPIPERVFTMISYAELGILDLSQHSPSVMYELALMHALGIPTLPVLLPSTVDKAQQLPFYLTQDYSAFVDNFEVETLGAALGPRIELAIAGNGLDPQTWSNPLTNYYGIPLVDASATTGLATGYYHNFLRHVIKQTNSVFTRTDGLKKIVILRPSSLDDSIGMRDPLQRRIRELGLDTVLIGRDDGQVYEDRDSARGQMLLFRAGNYIYDMPAPLVAQKSSPMHMRLARRLSRATGSQRGGAGGAARAPAASDDRRVSRHDRESVPNGARFGPEPAGCRHARRVPRPAARRPAGRGNHRCIAARLRGLRRRPSGPDASAASSPIP